MGGKQSHSKTSKKKSTKLEKGTISEEGPSQKHKEEHKKSLKKGSSNKSKERKKQSSSVPASIKRVGTSLKSDIGGVRRSKNWAVEDASKFVNKSLQTQIWDHLHCKLEVWKSSSGGGCKYEDWLQQKDKGAILGVNSNWITPYILAMSRPSDKMVEDQAIIFQFQRYGIGSVFNLQEPGEHPICGPGIKSITGLSYTPEIFMRNNVLYHNYPWRDMHCPSMTFSLDICQVMSSRISIGDKVAVHCHSGLGRTGLIIACYFIFSNVCSNYVEAIHLVRESRPEAIQTFNQVQHVRYFEEWLKDVRKIFGRPKFFYRVGEDLFGYMIRQHKYLHGQEERDLRCIPKIIYWITRDLIQRTDYDTTKRQPIAFAFMNELSPNYTKRRELEFVLQVSQIKQNLNAGIWDGVEKIDTQVLIHLLIEWLQLLEEPIVPDSILSWALGRGEIEGAIYELSRCGKCVLATIQILVCWMFQIIPRKSSLIRRMYSGLAHILLFQSTLKNDVLDEMPQRITRKRSSIANKLDNVFLSFKPTYLEIEYGLLLEAVARHWIKESKQLNVEGITARRTASISKSGVTLVDIALEDKKLKKPMNSDIMVGESWLRERPSLALGSSQDDNFIGVGGTSSFDQAKLNRILEEANKTPRSRYYHPKRSSCFGLISRKDWQYLPISPRILEPSHVKKKSRSSNLKHVM